MTESTIISKIWNMANVLRDDGVSYGDYLEQITYLLFLKMADEMNKPPYNNVKGKIYEGLLEKNAEDTKSGAGQYFTPRALIRAMVACVRPKPEKTIIDPACGTGGFFLASYDYIAAQPLNKDQKLFLKKKTFFGNEIVANTRRLCLMNLYLHNIGELDSEDFISPNDALVSDTGNRYDYVLTNPPFGKKSSITITNEDGELEKEDLSYNRQDFWETTSNKQLNFLQHIKTLLKINGQAAVVLPDNVLFEGGAGEEIRKQLMKTTELHTILRLPTGIFYANGVKANVLFFDNRPASKRALLTSTTCRNLMRLRLRSSETWKKESQVSERCWR